MRVLVLGGDGFCGWPTSLYLSDRGHDVTIVDNLSRRKIDVELEVQSLTPIRPIGERLRVWGEVSGREIGVAHLDLATDYDRLGAVLGGARRGRVERESLLPASPGSVCLLPKTLHQLMCALYAKNDGLQIPGLHPAIVWG